MAKNNAQNVTGGEGNEGGTPQKATRKRAAKRGPRGGSAGAGNKAQQQVGRGGITMSGREWTLQLR